MHLIFISSSLPAIITWSPHYPYVRLFSHVWWWCSSSRNYLTKFCHCVFQCSVFETQLMLVFFLLLCSAVSVSGPPGNSLLHLQFTLPPHSFLLLSVKETPSHWLSAFSGCILGPNQSPYKWLFKWFMFYLSLLSASTVLESLGKKKQNKTKKLINGWVLQYAPIINVS